MGGACVGAMRCDVFMGRAACTYILTYIHTCNQNRQPNSPPPHPTPPQSVEHRGGARNYHVLIRYILDRFQHRARWEGALDWALFEGTPPGARRVRFWWGLRDPVSGRHLAAELWRRYGALFREEGGKGRVAIEERGDLGHWPMLEDPVGAAAAVVGFFCRPGADEEGAGGGGGGAGPASSTEGGFGIGGLRAAL